MVQPKFIDWSRAAAGSPAIPVQRASSCRGRKGVRALRAEGAFEQGQQHASRARRSARVPAITWDAILSHIRDPTDADRLADSVRNRLLYRYAVRLYRHAADGYAAGRLAGLLAKQGRGRRAER